MTLPPTHAQSLARAKRLAAVDKLTVEGLTASVIAERLGLTSKTVQEIRRTLAARQL